MKKTCFSILMGLAIVGGVYFVFRSGQKELVPPAGEERRTAEEIKEVVLKDSESKESEYPQKPELIPRKILLDVPFTSQAPFAKWDERHEEACEEASLLMLAYFLQGKELNRDNAELELQKMMDFQIEKYGDYKDSNAAQIIQLAKDYFGLENLEVIYDFPKTEIKKELARGNPIILPAAGRELGNPNFTGLGPLYHVLLAKGYDGDTIITNDPGTRKGEGYRYDIDDLYYAIHDFPGSKEAIREGRKAMIVVEVDN